MYLTHLSLTDFRIFSRFDQDVPQNALILVGDNAQGKTSLLEAVYYLSALDSFQASNSAELINFSALQNDLAVCRIVADYRKGEKNHHLEIRIIRDTMSNGNASIRKEVLLDGSQIKINSVIGHFNAVLFLPHMLQIATGSPQRRRHYLNLTISQVDPRFNEALSEYNKALTQRNALLKQLNERSGDPDQLSYWDERITQAGSYIMHTRIQAIRDLGHLSASIHQELTRGEEILRLNYLPSYEPMPSPPGQIELPLDNPIDRSGMELKEIQGGFRERLLAQRKEEISRGVTALGPHRDDLRFISNGIDLGNFGSRGQLRTALLSIKLAEVAWLKEKTGHWPVLLLDEVLAELDDYRRQDLLERLAKTEQLLLTTTDLDLFSDEFQKTATRWEIQNGQLTV
ncbi:MAG: DNA replication and repair protein RecF [Anaerolineales bacterium]|nr:DNA replication and repair protein RecF [Anaerolineales bacterium]